MGILSSISRNLLSKFKSMSLKPKPMFLIEHEIKGTTNHSLLSPENSNSNRICTPTKCHRLVSSCKEWILFSSFSEELPFGRPRRSDVVVVDSKIGFPGRLSLWNPTTNRIKTAPPRLPGAPRRQERVFNIDTDCFGFGFDPKSNNYKLIRFNKVNTDVYTFQTNSWKPISEPPDSWKQIAAPPDVLYPYSHLLSVHVNGVYYWARARESILSFHFADETFSCISLPDVPHIKRRVSDYCLAEFHGSLAIVAPYWVRTEDFLLTEEEKRLQRPFSVEIWVWDGEMWSVGPRVAVGDFPVGDSIVRVLGLYQNEYLFLQGRKEAEIMRFNCKTGELENLGIHHDPRVSTTPDRRLRTFPYVFDYKTSKFENYDINDMVSTTPDKRPGIFPFSVAI